MIAATLTLSGVSFPKVEALLSCRRVELACSGVALGYRMVGLKVLVAYLGCYTGIAATTGHEKIRKLRLGPRDAELWGCSAA
jgi:hypothetical protein